MLLYFPASQLFNPNIIEFDDGRIEALQLNQCMQQDDAHKLVHG